MKKIITLLLFLTASVFYAQEITLENKKSLNSGVTVNSVSYMVDTIEELETIDWKNVKEVFESNKPEDIVEMSFGMDLKKSKYKFKSSIKVSGESKNIDSLIIKAKKGVKSIIKISKKYKN
ncbi:hypothetical protein FDT66_02455 [Polaribacter aestuariivivens]|uniref:Uncharacterized protein n=1 Tax=Polaribacter aestuariivivens TaxID=2304626 RepID=A0A5S3NFM9_9FLAO|nr:hypothetical protein [Polaribacter aestuariivivens]TMM32346.1 hypothetical protein FDT66_02455 [Polaribacter aestuariivivens]